MKKTFIMFFVGLIVTACVSCGKSTKTTETTDSLSVDTVKVDTVNCTCTLDSTLLGVEI